MMKNNYPEVDVMFNLDPIGYFILYKDKTYSLDCEQDKRKSIVEILKVLGYEENIHPCNSPIHKNPAARIEMLNSAELESYSLSIYDLQGNV